MTTGELNALPQIKRILTKASWVDHRSLAPLCRKAATCASRYATYARTRLIRSWLTDCQDLQREKVRRVSRSGCFVSFTCDKGRASACTHVTIRLMVPHGEAFMMLTNT